MLYVVGTQKMSHCGNSNKYLQNTLFAEKY